LKLIVGNEQYYEQYLFDQQFAHPGWSGIVSTIESQPESLLDVKKITLHDVIIFELLLEIDALDNQLNNQWTALSSSLETVPVALFKETNQTEYNEVIRLWQEIYEWNYYDEVLAGLRTKSKSSEKGTNKPKNPKSFQALLCIDDRETSLRDYLEQLDPDCETYATPGFFGVEFYFRPHNGKFNTKQCPNNVTPAYLIKEVNIKNKKGQRDAHFTKHSHGLIGGWLISQTLGFWSALKLFISIFHPSITPAASYSFNHMDKDSELTIENKHPQDKENGLQIGFTVDEMAQRVAAVLTSIGLVKDFAPIVYVIGHGSSSVNNPYYAAYDCGACSGRPGSVNARVFAFMANHPKVREELTHIGIIIPEETQFIGTLHDTCRDEIMYYDEQQLSLINQEVHEKNQKIFNTALAKNAKERSRRFDSINTKHSLKTIKEKIAKRSVSLFEPRPELNHATNALCIIGRRQLTQKLFLDRRAFMNSYDYNIDPDGKSLFNILKAAAPVCGGINLEYYFSRVDNLKLGAGTKLPHNVMGLLGVANGTDGDLRAGLPTQMIEIHDPIRLLIIVEHLPEVVLKTIQIAESTYEWFINEWAHLIVIHPETNEYYQFKNGRFIPYQTVRDQVQQIDYIEPILESTKENIPVYLLS
ncbi:MAG TPA: putative inorganic carbon transporter subunit DabA, partial [Cytophagaceae bacterium]